MNAKRIFGVLLILSTMVFSLNSMAQSDVLGDVIREKVAEIETIQNKLSETKADLKKFKRRRNLSIGGTVAVSGISVAVVKNAIQAYKTPPAPPSGGFFENLIFGILTAPFTSPNRYKDKKTLTIKILASVGAVAVAGGAVYVYVDKVNDAEDMIDELQEELENKKAELEQYL